MAGTSGSPFVSVVVTAYRRRRFLVGAVESILAQGIDRSLYEILVFKDFADPEIDDWLRTRDAEVRVVTKDLPRIGEMLAKGIELARGEVVCFLDDDDRFAPGKLTGIIGAFRGNPEVGLMRNSYSAIDADDKRLAQWDRFRPQTPTSFEIDPRSRSMRAFPAIYRYSAAINISTLTIRRRFALPWLEIFKEDTASQDHFVFLMGLVSDAKIRVEASRWNLYRVHTSTSHPNVGTVDPAGEIRDLDRSRSSGATMQKLADQVPQRLIAQRFVRTFVLEATVTQFLLDPKSHLSIGEWGAFVRTILWCRRRYLLVPAVYCLYRWIAPKSAIASYRARRHGTLQAVAMAPSA
jgi:hypothetical protein